MNKTQKDKQEPAAAMSFGKAAYGHSACDPFVQQAVNREIQYPAQSRPRQDEPMQPYGLD